MASPDTQLSDGARGPEGHVVIVSQKVQDIKLGGGARHNELARSMGRLRGGLTKRRYIPGDKLNAHFKPLSFDRQGNLVVDICDLQDSDRHNSLDVHVHHAFPLPLKVPPEQVPDDVMHSLATIVHDYCQDVTLDDGGNSQNMAVNLCLASLSTAFKDRLRVTVFSSTNPFERLPGEVREQIEQQHKFVPIEGLADRVAIQVPFEDDQGKTGTFALTTEPVATDQFLGDMFRSREELLDLFRQGTCYIASDPLIPFIKTHGDPKNWYAQMVNASTAFRSLVANMAYGTDVILPMNSMEAADVTRVLEHRGSDEELHKVKLVPFPSPYKTNGFDIHPESLLQLDRSLWKLHRYNPPHPSRDRITFNYPITFGEEGGLVVGTSEYKMTVCFTTIVAPEKERELVEPNGVPAEMKWDKRHVVGAGDASASIVALFNTMDPSEFIRPHMEGREPDNTKLLHYANTIFVSALSRVVGCFLTRTQKTFIANIDLAKLPSLFNAVGKEALDVARGMVKSGEAYKTGHIPTWDMNVVVWPLGRIAQPDTDAE